MKANATDFPLFVRSWADLAALIEHFSKLNGWAWLFRGVTNEAYELIPKVGRPRFKGIKRFAYNQADEKAVLEMFRQRGRAYLPSAPTDLEWLALAQHFGVPTRLLDWSDNLLVAAWFAVQQPSSGDPRATNGGIWVTRNVPPLHSDPTVDPFALSKPMIYRPPHIAPRVGAQGSVLMLCPTPDKPVTLREIYKIVISGEGRFQIRKRLNACGINSQSMFGDLAGLGSHVAWMHQNNWLANHRSNAFESLLDLMTSNVDDDDPELTAAPHVALSAPRKRVRTKRVPG
jgi:hypothetical protein